MWIFRASVAAVAALLSFASPAAGAEAETRAGEAPADIDEEMPAGLIVVEANVDPIREQLQLIANPLLSEERAQRLFDQLIARRDEVLPTMAAVYRDATSTDMENWIAARALGRIGGKPAMRTLIAGVDSPRIITRLGAVSGLGLLREKEGAEALERALFDKAATVRAYAADALAAAQSRRSAPALSDALNLPANFFHGKSMFVRKHIIDALGEIGSIAGIDALISALDDPEPYLSNAASRALTRITGAGFRDPTLPPEAAPGESEIAQWKAWWSQRRVGETVE
jgi:HEAT repeat protein